MLSRTSGTSSLALTWGADNKLAQVTVGAAVTKYLYTADDARALKVAPQASGQESTSICVCSASTADGN